MSSGLEELARRVAEDSPPHYAPSYGPWAGSMRSRARDKVPREFMADGFDMDYLPRTGTFKTRKGSTEKFDTFASPAGLLPYKSSTKVRWADEFLSSSLCSDGVPTQMALMTRETILSGLDDGRFSSVYVRDQVANSNYTLGSEFNATEYPDAGTVQRYNVVPLWYDSGDGGLTRGTFEFARRFFVSGSRRFVKVGDEVFFPSLLGTPSRWNGDKATATGSKHNVVMPTGPIPPVHAGSLAAGTAADAGEDGPWKGADRVLYSVAYRNKDGSVWMPCMPRLPNDILTNGYNLFTVNSGALTTSYRSVVWSNIPIGPPGTVSRLLLMSLKQSYSDGANMKFNVFDLRLVQEIRDNTTTTFEVTNGDDSSWKADEAQLVIRYDHAMAPRARYNFAGDMRVGHGYGQVSPCAIILAPVGRAADYDLNVAYDAATAYNNNHFIVYVGLGINAAASSLNLQECNGAASVTLLTYDLATYDTLQKLVDKINTTTVASNGSQWRAQLAPGVSGESNSFAALTPHYRLIDVSYTTGSPTVTAASGLSKVAVGAKIRDIGLGSTTFPTTAYVLRVNSDTSLTMSENATGLGGALNAGFYFDLGDAHGSTRVYAQRIIANSLPGFLYFNKTTLDAAFPLDKTSVWLTVGSPGSSKAAPNCFSIEQRTRFRPPINPGICQGGAPCDQGFVIGYSNKIASIRFREGQTTGLDEDLELHVLNESRGCCAWNTIAPGNRFVPYLTPEGMVCADLYAERPISDAIWLHDPALGDFDYEIPLCRASAAADTDAQYAHARVLRSAIHVTFRSSGSHPNRRIKYDFSTGEPSNGLDALIRPPSDRWPGLPWGWSEPHRQSFSVLSMGHRSDGEHVYGWNEQNSGSTGDGRIDEFETGDQDNGTDVTAYVLGPWETLGTYDGISAQELIVDHITPAGAVAFLDFHRSLFDVTYALPLESTDAIPWNRETVFLPQEARVVTDAVYSGYRQTSGRAGELRSFQLIAKRCMGPRRSATAIQAEAGQVIIGDGLLPEG